MPHTSPPRWTALLRLSCRSLLGAALLAGHAFGAAPGGPAQFMIPDASTQYSARIEVASCDKDSCSGPATVQLIDRATAKPVQSFKTEDMSILLDAAKPAVNNTQLYSDQSAIVIGDFNFDGSEDIAIRNGNNSGYGGPSYDVYVYNATRKKFVPAADLTELASTKLGMFEVDAKRRRLITYEKDGCCWHLRTEYAVVPGQGLLDVRTVEEAVQPDGEHVAVTVSERVAGKWRRQKHIYKTADYYK